MSISLTEGYSWANHISQILRGASKVAAVLDKGEAAVVRCSDGWDRTAQICSLSSILVEPRFRTIKGLVKVILKEWVFFGHKFVERNYAGKNSKEDEMAPIFLQFLHALSEILRQFPGAFEFNEEFLVFIGDCAVSGMYGEFLFKCEKDLREQDGKYLSLVEELFYKNNEINQKEENKSGKDNKKNCENECVLKKFENPLFRKGKYKRCLYPCFSEKRIGVWKKFMNRFNDWSEVNGNHKNYLILKDYEAEIEKRLFKNIDK